jgi:hypothetical protein
MTKQDKIVGRIGPVIIRNNGYFVDPLNLHSRHTKDRLLEFLNVDSTNKTAVDVYCEENAYIPKDISSGWLTAFQQEQNEVKQIAEKISQGKIGNNEIDFIIKKLRDMPIKYQSLTEKELARLNVNLFWLNEESRLETNQHPDPANLSKHPVRVKNYISSQHLIWDSLLSIINQKRPIRQCADMLTCRRFFFPHKRRPDQKYCTPECEDRARSRRKK